ncbi:hypothetical protein G3257_19115 [Janthinobacterium lividum]|uniref:hypothetical protein n=1 Tax=Janthinobacterium lividum TaxID=29581 RepID=UPI0015955803|nr:hypothetical protein [Janthinobacterium lividum]QKY04160.1 hypothetical protein G3257_19115 [Janthinobacterium lividum]
MSDFFYYGQKDTIQRLNELAGRGAVVASYVPAVGRSPLGGPNGYMDAAWIDTTTPIKTQHPISVGMGMENKYGYNFLKSGGANSFYKLATLESNNIGSFASLRIDAMVGEWAAETLTPMTIVIGSRDPAGSVKVEWSSSRGISSAVKFLAYKESNGKFSIYLYFSPGVFAQASLQMMCMGGTTYATPVETTSATGDIAWDSSAAPGTTAYMPPRMKGMSPGAGTSFDSLVEVRSFGGEPSSTSYLAGAPKTNTMAAGQEAEAIRIGVSGNANVSYAGFFSALVSVGVNASPFALGYKLAFKARDIGSGNYTPTLFSISGNGTVYAPILKAGSSDASILRHNISRIAGQGTEILYVGQDGAANPSVAVVTADGAGGWNNAGNVLYVGKNSSTGSSIRTAGTVNTMGNDYAEYIFKCSICGIVAPGQIVGITADNKVTDKWDDAVMFSIKSTAPSFVGGDSWASDVGSRPSPQAGPAPTQPLRRADVLAQQPVPGTNPSEYEDVVTEAGDTDEEWAEKHAAYTAALAAHNIAVQQDAEAMATFDAALEAERQKVDRIAIAGRVPVNVLGAQPGDYIVPVQDGAGIEGIPVRQADLTHLQYLQAVGRVISIEPDGRAYVMVKVV